MSHLGFKQADANNQQTQAIVTWKELKTAGIPIDYRRFEQLWQAENEQGPLHNLVDHFNGQGLVIKTLAKDQPTKGSEEKPGKISQMAKRATQKALKNH